MLLADWLSGGIACKVELVDVTANKFYSKAQFIIDDVSYDNLQIWRHKIEDFGEDHCTHPEKPEIPSGTSEMGVGTQATHFKLNDLPIFHCAHWYDSV